jgi:hypothetical protein
MVDNLRPIDFRMGTTDIH